MYGRLPGLISHRTPRLSGILSARGGSPREIIYYRGIFTARLAEWRKSDSLDNTRYPPPNKGRESSSVRGGPHRKASFRGTRRLQIVCFTFRCNQMIWLSVKSGCLATSKGGLIIPDVVKSITPCVQAHYAALACTRSSCQMNSRVHELPIKRRSGNSVIIVL